MLIYNWAAKAGATWMLCAVLLIGCSDRRITQANVNEVTEGMSKKQVESILGQPNAVEVKDPIAKATAYVYRQGKETVTILFKDDKVQSKQSDLSQ